MGLEINRNFKDTLFRKIFDNKKDLLSLYNALNDTEHTDEDLIEINTIEDAIYIGYKNDISFVIDSELNLYEHQSSVNQNMPIRGLIYLTELYKGYIERNKLRIYNETPVKLPFPRYIVFYNGRDGEPERRVMPLSDSYMTNDSNKGQKPCLELEALLVNINYGCNKEIMNKCQKLMEYSQLIALIRKNDDDLVKKYAKLGIHKSKKEIFAEAVSLAIEEAIRNNILKEILRNNKAEVTNMLLTEFDEKDYIEGVKEESERRGREEGRMEGRLEERLEGKIYLIIKKVKKSKSLQIIASELEEEEADIRPIYDAVVASAPDYDMEEIKAKLNM